VDSSLADLTLPRLKSSLTHLPPFLIACAVIHSLGVIPTPRSFPYGIGALTSFENVLSLPLESTAVVT
jgi:hypothetical protein